MAESEVPGVDSAAPGDPETAEPSALAKWGWNVLPIALEISIKF